MTGEKATLAVVAALAGLAAVKGRGSFSRFRRSAAIDPSEPTWAWGTTRGQLLGKTQNLQRVATKLSQQPNNRFAVQVSIDGGPLVHLWAGTGRSFLEYLQEENGVLVERRWVKKARDENILRRAEWAWEDVYSNEREKVSRRFNDLAVNVAVNQPRKYFNVYVYIDGAKDAKRVWSGQGSKLREILKERPGIEVEWVKKAIADAK